VKEKRRQAIRDSVYKYSCWDKKATVKSAREEVWEESYEKVKEISASEWWRDRSYRRLHTVRRTSGKNWAKNTQKKKNKTKKGGERKSRPVTDLVRGCDPIQHSRSGEFLALRIDKRERGKGKGTLACTTLEEGKR